MPLRVLELRECDVPSWFALGRSLTVAARIGPAEYRRPQQLPPQAMGIAMLQVAEVAGEDRADRRQLNLAARILPPQRPQLPLEPQTTGPLDTPVVRKHLPAEERHARPHRQHHALAVVQLEPVRHQERPEFPQQLVQLAFVVAEGEKVVGIADVAVDPPGLLDEVVQRVQHDVGKELAGEIADGDAPAALVRREQVIAGEVDDRWLLRVAAVDDGLQQVQRRPALELALQQGPQDLVVHRREELDHVALEHVAVPSAELRAPVEGGVRALRVHHGSVARGALWARRRRCAWLTPTRDYTTGAAGIRVVDERPVKQRLDDAAHRVVHHPVAIRRRRDQPRLRVADLEGVVRARLVLASHQLPPERQQVRLQSEVERGDIGPEALAPIGGAFRGQEVLPGDQFVEQLSVTFHGFGRAEHEAP